MGLPGAGKTTLANELAKLIKAKTELIAAVAEFERITRISAPDKLDEENTINFTLPLSLEDALKKSSSNNPGLIIGRINLAI